MLKHSADVEKLTPSKCRKMKQCPSFALKCTIQATGLQKPTPSKCTLVPIS